MSVELDGTVHFSVAPGTRHGAVLQALEAAEKKLVSILRTAATAVNHLVPQRTGEDSSSIAFSTSSTEFLQLIKEVHGELADQIHLVSDYRAYGRSAYSAEKDMEITLEKVRLISEQLKSLSSYLDENLMIEESHPTNSV
uniref:Mediator of RNA polymerase II transcription subunit 11 n=1 Tax=Albugo laibachii Nc14 TaxID=890382 RepID=F0W6H4_9STRA|nr:conserved hypothetical protein [Albugo laibachii Nc14]CCA21823.1 conserved hypothetical protein [Albugo laibachii Nc14]|eukprot:CCA21823.1 conserved hypothetical protein [Albugo laibachii Nc14]